MVVAVSGAAGFIGSAVVRRLVGEGRRVRAILEPGANAANLAAMIAEKKIEAATADVCDAEAMKRALDGAEAFYHLAAIYKVWMPDPTPIYRVNVEGATTALLAAQSAGVGKVVFTSSIAAVGLRDDGAPSDETVAWNLANIANDYILTKHLSERIAVAFSKSVPITIVNPAFPFGPGDVAPTPTGKIILSILRGEIPAVSEGGFNAIDVDDVAAGHVAAEARGRIGERYILGDHNVSFAEFVDLVARVGGVAAPKITVPRSVARLSARAMEAWSRRRGGEPTATLKSVLYMEKRAWFDSTKARRELSLPSTPLEVSVERAVRWFKDSNMA